MVYKANRYYTTMNYDTFLILGTNKATLDKANELQLMVIEDNCNDNVQKLYDFINAHSLITIDDIDSPMEISEIDNNTYQVVKDDEEHTFEIINDFTSRF